MRVNSTAYRSIWPVGQRAAGIIDQTRLPHEFTTIEIADCAAMVRAIATMQVRGAPLIGASAAYGVALAMNEDPSDAALQRACAELEASRPTAVNLRWAVARMRGHLSALAPAQRASQAWREAGAIADEDVSMNRAIGSYASAYFAQLHARLDRPVNILTHCNAGWLATVDYGTALAGIFLAFDAGVPLHVWVDETRPRNQGLLTAWELRAHGVPHTIIADNAGGHLMQHGRVDAVIVGADRVGRDGAVCNKIGTYLKALAAHDNGVPFFAAVPSPTIDWALRDAVREVPIEERSADELRLVAGLGADGARSRVALFDAAEAAANPAFDVTPPRLVTGIVTERGIAPPARLADLFPEHA